MNTKKISQEGGLTKQELFQTSLRWTFASQICWNYERMMSTGYLYAMMPFLRRKYGDDAQQMKEMMQTHIQFFNSNPWMAHFIIGIDLALEEKEGFKAKDAVAGIKTGLMGPFAGVGDTLQGVILPTVFGSIASYMALKGNPIGLLIWFAVNIGIFIARFTFTPIGYHQGLKLVGEFSDRLKRLTDAAILLGVTVVGALIPTVVKAQSTFVFKSGKVSLQLQQIFDQIMPALIPAVLVFLVYWLLGKKGMTSTKAILLIMVLSIVLYNLKIVG